MNNLFINEFHDTIDRLHSNYLEFKFQSKMFESIKNRKNAHTHHRTNYKNARVIHTLFCCIQKKKIEEFVDWCDDLTAKRNQFRREKKQDEWILLWSIKLNTEFKWPAEPREKNLFFFWLFCCCWQLMWNCLGLLQKCLTLTFFPCQFFVCPYNQKK